MIPVPGTCLLLDKHNNIVPVCVRILPSLALLTQSDILMIRQCVQAVAALCLQTGTITCSKFNIVFDSSPAAFASRYRFVLKKKLVFCRYKIVFYIDSDTIITTSSQDGKDTIRNATIHDVNASTQDITSVQDCSTTSEDYISQDSNSIQDSNSSQESNLNLGPEDKIALLKELGIDPNTSSLPSKIVLTEQVPQSGFFSSLINHFL